MLDELKQENLEQETAETMEDEAVALELDENYALQMTIEQASDITDVLGLTAEEKIVYEAFPEVEEGDTIANYIIWEDCSWDRCHHTKSPQCNTSARIKSIT